MDKTFETWVKSMEKKRTLSEILIDADKCKNFAEIDKIAKEMVASQDRFPHHEYVYGLEHIQNIANHYLQQLKLKKMLNE